MLIWIDADACPKVIKEILFKAGIRTNTKITLVANQRSVIPKNPLFSFVQVSQGFDVADSYIVEHLTKGDLVITADIPLAAEVIAKGGFALNPRGEFYTKENIGERLAMRNMMDELRSSGQITGGPEALGNKEKQAFANSLDKFLAKN